MTAKTKTKAAALLVPQSLDEASALLAAYGEHANAIVRLNADLAEASAQLKATVEAEAKPHQEACKDIFKRLEAFGAARRSELLKGGAKTARLPAGEIGWAIDPPSVKVTGLVGAAVAWLQTSYLGPKFLRTKHELDKQAMLKEPDKAEEVPGITIVRDVEQFFVAPAGLELAEDAP